MVSVTCNFLHLHVFGHVKNICGPFDAVGLPSLIVEQNILVKICFGYHVSTKRLVFVATLSVKCSRIFKLKLR